MYLGCYDYNIIISFFLISAELAITVGGRHAVLVQLGVDPRVNSNVLLYCALRDKY